MKGQKQEEDLIPVVRAAGELRRSYIATRDLALRGTLVLVWRGIRMFVTRASVDQELKASTSQDRAPVGKSRVVLTKP